MQTWTRAPRSPPTGSPRCAGPCLHSLQTRLCSAGARPTKAWFAKNANLAPRPAFPPDRVTALSSPPAAPPSRTSNGVTSTWNSRTASSENQSYNSIHIDGGENGDPYYNREPGGANAV